MFIQHICPSAFCLALVKRINSLHKSVFYMSEPTLPQIFGTGTVRLANGAAAPSAGLFIPDTALITGGLTTPSTATAEAHFLTINLNAKSYLTQTNFDANIDQSLIVDNGFSSFVFRGTNNIQYRTDQLTISLAKLDTNNTIDPADY